MCIRDRHPTDRRAVLVELTEAATATMARMQDEHAQLNETLLSAIDPADRAAVERGLSAVAAHLEHLVTTTATPAPESAGAPSPRGDAA